MGNPGSTTETSDYFRVYIFFCKCLCKESMTGKLHQDKLKFTRFSGNIILKSYFHIRAMYKYKALNFSAVFTKIDVEIPF